MGIELTMAIDETAQRLVSISPDLFSLSLTPRECKILAMFAGVAEVAIDDLHAQHLATEDMETTPRSRQMHTGAVISQLNKKLKKLGLRIAPSQRLKRTYELIKIIS